MCSLLFSLNLEMSKHWEHNAFKYGELAIYLQFHATEKKLWPSVVMKRMY